MLTTDILATVTKAGKASQFGTRTEFKHSVMGSDIRLARSRTQVTKKVFFLFKKSLGSRQVHRGKSVAVDRNPDPFFVLR